MTNPAPNSPDGEKVLTIVTGGLGAACLVVWTAGQVAARLWTGTWLQVPLLESPLILWRLATNPGQPVQAWPPAAAHFLPGPIAYYTTLTLLAAVLIAVGAIGHRWHDQNRNSSDRESARWAKPRDLRPLLIRRPQPGRLTLGTVHRRLIATEAQHSVAVIGPAGTGKTTGFAIPALLEWDGPVIATSVKGDLLEHTINHRRSIGEAYVFDPVGSTAEPSAGWSPLHSASDWQGALRMAAWLVSTARAGERGGLQDSDFWYAVAQKLLAPLLFAAARSEATMTDVMRWVDLQDEEEPLRALQRTGELDALQAFAATINREERTRSSAYTTAETVLAAFADPGVLATTTRQPAIDPDRLLDGGNHTLYICGPLHEQARLRPLFTALIEQTVARIYDRANRSSRPAHETTAPRDRRGRQHRAAPRPGPDRIHRPWSRHPTRHRLARLRTNPGPIRHLRSDRHQQPPSQGRTRRNLRHSHPRLHQPTHRRRGRRRRIPKPQPRRT